MSGAKIPIYHGDRIDWKDQIDKKQAHMYTMRRYREGGTGGPDPPSP